jgi:hypothetical protein
MHAQRSVSANFEIAMGSFEHKECDEKMDLGSKKLDNWEGN